MQSPFGDSGVFGEPGWYRPPASYVQRQTVLVPMAAPAPNRYARVGAAAAAVQPIRAFSTRSVQVASPPMSTEAKVVLAGGAVVALGLVGYLIFG